MSDGWYDGSESVSTTSGHRDSHSGSVGLGSLGRVDPRRDGLGGTTRRCPDDSLRVGQEGAIENPLTHVIDVVDLVEVDAVGCRQARPGMVVITVVPVEEGPAERPGVLDAAEALRQFRLVPERLEWRSETESSLDV